MTKHHYGCVRESRICIWLQHFMEPYLLYEDMMCLSWRIPEAREHVALRIFQRSPGLPDLVHCFCGTWVFNFTLLDDYIQMTSSLLQNLFVPKFSVESKVPCCPLLCLCPATELFCCVCLSILLPQLRTQVWCIFHYFAFFAHRKSIWVLPVDFHQCCAFKFLIFCVSSGLIYQSRISPCLSYDKCVFHPGQSTVASPWAHLQVRSYQKEA